MNHHAQRRATNRFQIGLGTLIAITLFVLFSNALGALGDLRDALTGKTDEPAPTLIIDTHP